MTDPHTILTQAGIECPEVEAYRSALRSTYVDRCEPDVGRTYDLVDEDAADAALAALAEEAAKWKWIAEHTDNFLNAAHPHDFATLVHAYEVCPLVDARWQQHKADVPAPPKPQAPPNVIFKGSETPKEPRRG